MDQLHWMVGLIPDEYLMLLALLVIGLGFILYFSGFFLRWIPGLTGYTFPLRLLGIVIGLSGTFLAGGIGNELIWRHEIAAMKEKVKNAEAQAAAATRTISEDVKKETVVIKEKSDTIVKYVDKWNDREIVKTVEGPERVRVEEVIKYIENCPVPKELLDAHNSAATMNRKTEGEKK
ncbi:hypothetical protein EB118_20845 [bacterium]|nr:hypothetical protein [Synechococcaceae bacterium WB6_1A_059]NDG32508.1 hypothetical protein [bacterium]NDG79904.1 hypothetical protein [Synechococcaceae bacterium WB8_1B_057]